MPNGSPKILREAGRADLVTLVTTDYGGITRGRSITRRDYERARGKAHCGWVPANMSLTPFDVIPEQTFAYWQIPKRAIGFAPRVLRPPWTSS